MRIPACFNLYLIHKKVEWIDAGRQRARAIEGKEREREISEGETQRVEKERKRKKR